MTQAKYEFSLDHDNDFEFGDANEDMTDRVLARSVVSLTRGLDTIRVGSPSMAGEMNGVELNNKDRLLSSFNTGSALNGKLKPGRRCEWRTVATQAAFTGPDSTTVPVAPQIGAAWQILSGQWGNVGNQLYHPVNTGTFDAIVSDAGVADCVVEAKFAVVTEHQRLVFRATDTNNYLFVQAEISSGLCNFYKRSGGVNTSLGAVNVTPADGDLVRVELLGPWLHLSVNGTGLATKYETHNQTATKHGIGGQQNDVPNARWDDFKVSVPLWNGITRNRRENPAPGAKSVTYTALGMLSRLAKARGQGIYTALHLNKRVDELAGILLDACGLTDLRYRVFDRCYTVVRFWALRPDEDPLEALFALVRAEDGLLFEDGLGRLVLRSRYARDLNPRQNTSQVTIHDAAPDEPRFSDVLLIDEGHPDIVNEVQFTHKRRELQPVAQVWELGHALTLGPNESISLDVTADDPFTGAITPILNTDYFITSGSLSSGPTLVGTSGYKIEIDLTAGAGGAAISMIRVRAQSAAVVETRTITQSIDTSASKDEYDTVVYPYTVPAEVDAIVLRAIADRIVTRRKDPRATVVYQVVNANQTRLNEILFREIGDRITVEEAHSGLNHGFFVTQVEHEIAEAGGTHYARFGAERAEDAVTRFQFGVSRLSGGHKLG